MDQDHGCREHGNRAKLQKRAQIIARRQEHPHRQDGGGQAINHDRPCEPFLVVSKPRLNRRKMREKLSAPNAKCQPEQSKNSDRNHAHFSRAQTDSHDQRHRDGRRDGENAPWTLCKGLDDDQREHGQQNNHDCQHTDQGECADARPDFFFHHLTKRLAAAADRREKHDHIVHAASERRADQNPKRAGQETKLSCQHRTHQRSRTGNRRKVMPENHPAICGHIVLAVVLQDCRCGSLVVEHQYLCRQPFAVKTIADAKRAKARHDNPKGADSFAAGER